MRISQDNFTKKYNFSQTLISKAEFIKEMGIIELNKEQFVKYPDGFYMWFSGDREYYVSALWQYYTKMVDKKGELSVKLDKNITNLRPSNKRVKFIIPHISKPLSNKVGTLLLDFLNADFSNFENAYNTFFYKYGFSLIIDDYIKECSEAKENEVYMKMNFEFSKHTTFFSDWQRIYKNFINYVYGFEEYADSKTNQYSKLSKFEAYAIMDDVICRDSKNIEIRSDNYFERHYLTDNIKSLEELTKLIDNNDPRFVSNDVYFFDDLGKAIFMDFKMLVQNDEVVVKKCKNCGRYFEPINRQAEVYCNLPNLDGSPTCKSKGAGEIYRKNLKEVEGLLTYRRTYQKRIMEVSRNRADKKLKARFDNWKKKAQEKIKAYKNDLITEDELNTWMNENKDI